MHQIELLISPIVYYTLLYYHGNQILRKGFILASFPALFVLQATITVVEDWERGWWE